MKNYRLLRIDVPSFEVLKIHLRKERPRRSIRVMEFERCQGGGWQSGKMCFNRCGKVEIIWRGAG